MEKSYAEILLEIKKIFNDWKALPYTQEEIDRISNEIQHRVYHKPHLKDYEKGSNNE